MTSGINTRAAHRLKSHCVIQYGVTWSREKADTTYIVRHPPHHLDR